MNFQELMPNKDKKPTDLETLHPFNHGHNIHDVYGIRNEDNITYQSFSFDEVIEDDHDNSYSIILDLNKKIGKIVNDDGIKVSFRFKIDDGFFELEKIKSIHSQLENAGFDKDDFNDISANIRNYLLNHGDYLIEIVDESNGNDIDVYSFDDRINPPFDDKIAADFQEMLKLKYASSFIKYMEDIVPDLIVDENENIIKITLSCIAVILGIYSYIIQLLGDAGIGKSYVIDVVLDYIIPKGYSFDINSITEAAFIFLGELFPRFFERLILNFGDLGDPSRLESMANILDIVKILITEHRFDRYKMEKETKSKNIWDSLEHLVIIAESIACIYGTVKGDKEDGKSDAKGQKESRTLNATPTNHSDMELINFSQNAKTYGTYGHDDFEKSRQSLMKWQEFLKMRISQYDADKYVLIMPFRNMFDKILEFSKVKIRDFNIFESLLSTMAYMNLERSITIEKDGKIFVIPCLDDVNDFIKIIYDNVGLNVAEKHLLLKLKQEFAFNYDEILESENLDYDYKYHDDYSDDEHYDEIIQTCIASAVIDIDGIPHGKNLDEWMDDLKGQNDKTKYLQEQRYLDKIYSKYGMTKWNRKHNKEIRKKKNPNLEDIRPQIFFTVTDLKYSFGKHHAIKNVPDLSQSLIKLKEKGFLNYLDYKNNRDANIYYVEPQILKIQDEYEMKPIDRIQAIATLMTSFHVFDENDIRKVCKDYKVQFSVVKNYIEEHR